MRRATGSNTPPRANKVSIQLSLDGHSFSVADFSQELRKDIPVEVELLTPKTMLAPAEAFDKSCAGALLAAAGIPVQANECVVCSDSGARTVAVMAVGTEPLRQLTERFGEDIRLTTPLLHEPASQGPTVWIRRTTGLLYIKVYDAGLQLAEVIEAPEDADIRYFFERLGTEFSTKNHTLLVAGNTSRALCKEFGKGFKKASCE